MYQISNTFEDYNNPRDIRLARETGEHKKKIKRLNKYVMLYPMK